MIPVVLDIGVLLIMPKVLEENHFLPALVIGASALAAPWILFVIISRLVSGAVERAHRERDEAEHVDFV
jgi:hypothetical protein